MAEEPGLSMEEYRRVDVGDADEVSGLVAEIRPDWIFNLAGVSFGDDHQMYRVNVTGAINVLEAVRFAKLDARIVLVGSAAEYGLVPLRITIGPRAAAPGKAAVDGHATDELKRCPAVADRLLTPVVGPVGPGGDPNLGDATVRDGGYVDGILERKEGVLPA